jgi:hypothetical protein
VVSTQSKQGTADSFFFFFFFFKMENFSVARSHAGRDSWHNNRAHHGKQATTLHNFQAQQVQDALHIACSFAH